MWMPHDSVESSLEDTLSVGRRCGKNAEVGTVAPAVVHWAHMLGRLT